MLLSMSAPIIGDVKRPTPRYLDQISFPESEFNAWILPSVEENIIMLPDEIKQLGEVCPVCKRPFPKVEENIEELESFVDEHDSCYYKEEVEVV